MLAATLADEERSIRLVHEHLVKRLTELDAKEENLLDLVEDGGAIATKVRTRLVAIGEERVRVKAELETQGPLLEAGAALITAALDLLDNPQELYRQTTDPVRRQLNQVFFDRLYLDVDEVTNDRLAEPFNDFFYHRSLSQRRLMDTRGHWIGTPNGATWDAAGGKSTGAALLDRTARGEGSSKATMVELRGRLSNPDGRRIVRDVQAVMKGNPASDSSGERAANCVTRLAPERVRVRLGDEAVAELVAAFIAGATRAGLADQYGVSLSSVKRLLRSSGIRRRCGPVVDKPVQHRAGGSSPRES